MAPTTNRLSISKGVFWTLLILLIALIAACAYLFVQYRRGTPSPQLDSAAETRKVVTEIKKLMIIPDDSGAVLATIADKSKLSGQKFFEFAQNGDDVVLFPAIGKAVLYRPTIQRIIDVGPFNPDPNQGRIQQSASTTIPVSVKKATTSTSVAPKKVH